MNKKMASVPTKIIFSEAEKELLVSLIKQEKVLKDKRTIKPINKLKTEAWDRIKRRYNNRSFVTKREAVQLRRCWEKLKRLRRDAHSKKIEMRRLTGGGSISPPNGDYVPGDEEEPDLKPEISNTMDCDTVFTEERNTETYETPNDWDSKDNPLSTSTPNILRAESPTQGSSSTSSETSHQERERRPVRLVAVNQPDLIKHDTNTVRKPLALPTANDADILRRKNILIEREQQRQIYLYRRSILNIEKDMALEKLRHMKEMNRVKELMEVENLDHTRAMNQLLLRRASDALI